MSNNTPSHIVHNKYQNTVSILTPEQRSLLNHHSRSVQAVLAERARELELAENGGTLNVECDIYVQKPLDSIEAKNKVELDAVFISSTQASSLFINKDGSIGCGVRKIQVWCEQGRIEDCRKNGQKWLIPRNCKFLIKES